MPRMRYIAGALTLAVGSVGFGLFAATAGAQVGGGTGTITGTASAGGTTATGTVTSGSGPTAVPRAVGQQAPAPVPVAPSGGGADILSKNNVQVIAGNHTGPCSPIVAQQVTNSNSTVAINNGSANNSPTSGVIGGNDSQPGNGRGTGDIGNIKNNTVNQNVNVSCFNNSSPQTVTRTVVVPQTVTKTVVVPQTQTVVQQATAAAPIITTAHFTG